jgi:hypothetical protein
MRICQSEASAPNLQSSFWPRAAAGARHFKAMVRIFAFDFSFFARSPSFGVTRGEWLGPLVAHYQAQPLAAYSSGAHPPDINQQLAGNGNDRLSLEGLVGSGQDRIPPLWSSIEAALETRRIIARRPRWSRWVH